MLMANTEIGLWKNEFSLVGDESHFVLLSVTLDELGNSGGICSSNKNDIEISLGSWHIWLSFTASHSSRLGGNESDGLSLASGLN